MKNPLLLNLPSIKIHMEAKVLTLDPAFIHKTIEITGIKYSAKRKPRRTTMTIINKWLEAIKKFFTNAYPEPIVTKPTARKTNVKRTARKKSK
tara:strand:+ start:295 stop:573 length:279 start_codon:yes stop_codon:yes gene_type:complete